MRLFLNPGNSAYLRGLAGDFRESTNAVRIELNRFEEAGMLSSEIVGNKKVYKANDKHTLFKDINNIVLKYAGLDKIIDIVTTRLGDIDRIYVSGDYAAGKDSGIIDLILIGEVNREYLTRLIKKAEEMTGKKIRYVLYEKLEDNESNRQTLESALLLWNKDK